MASDDVLFVPQRSRVASRRDVSTRSLLTRRIELALPIVSANMDTGTESAMAIALAREGGIGVVHRFLLIEHAAPEVAQVKRYLNYVIDDPYWIAAERTVAEARAEATARGVTGLLVSDGEGRLLGILTARDVRAEPDDRLVREAMTPRERLVLWPPARTSDPAPAKMRASSAPGVVASRRVAVGPRRAVAAEQAA